MAVKKQTFMKGVFVIMISQILIKFFGFIYRIVLTNFKEFADEGNSYYGSGFRVYTLLLAIATMGIPNTLSKLVSEKIAIGDKRGAHRIFRTALLLFTIIGIVFSLMLFFGAGFISTNILHNPGVKYTLMALSPAIIFVAMTAVLRGYFVGMQNMIQYSKAQVLEQIVNSIFSIVFVVMLLGTTPEIMAAGSTLATTLSAATAFTYMYIYYSRNKKDIWQDIKESERFAIDSRKKIVKKLISYVIPISFGSVVVALSGIVDLVTVMQGLEKFGYTLEQANEKFGILLGKVDILVALPLSVNVAFAVALVPYVSGMIAKGDKKEAVKKINYSLKISSIIAFPAAAGLSLLAGPIFLLIFPNASNGAYLLQIQAWMVVFSVLAQTIYGALQGMGKLYVPGTSLAIAMVIKYILNVIFVPVYGEVVPAITTVIFQIIAATMSFILLFIYLKQKPNMKEIFLKPIYATILMSISVYLLNKGLEILNISNSINTVISIIFAIIIYLFALILFKVLNEEEILQLPKGAKINKIIGNLSKNR